MAIAALLALSGMGGVGPHYGSFSRQGRDEDLLPDTVDADQRVEKAVSAQAKAQLKRDRRAAKRIKDAA